MFVVVDECREGCPTLPPALTVQPDSLEAAPNTTNNNSSSSQEQHHHQQPVQQAAEQPLHQDKQQQQEGGPPTAAAEGGPLMAAAATPLPAAPADVNAPVRRSVPPSATTAYMTQSIMPQHANTLGITFGGQVG